MAPPRRHRLLASALAGGALCLLLVAGPSTGQAARGTDIAVVVHGQLDVEGLSLIQLRKIYLGERQFWNPQQRVILLVRDADSPEQQMLLERVCGMDEARYRRHWRAKILRDEAAPNATPIPLSSPAVVAQALNHPDYLGAIALMQAAQVPPGARILAIEGHRPGEAGYPLR